MNQVTLQAVVDAPIASAFAYVDDYTNVKDWVYGFRKFEPLTEQVSGVGATFDAEVKIGAKLPARVEVTAYEQDALIAMTSIKGIESSFQLTFEADGDTRTRVASTVEYRFPGGIAGKAMEKLVSPLVVVASRYVEQTLKRCVEDAFMRGEI